MHLLGEKSFEELTVQDIAARATVNRATFYAHFSDKYALLDEVIGINFAKSLEGRLVVPAADAAGHLRQLLLAVTDQLGAVGSHCRHSFKTFEALVEAQIKAGLRAHVQSWLAVQPGMQGQPAQRFEVVAALLSWSIYGAAFEWHKQTSGRRPADTFADEVVPLLAATIGALDSNLREPAG
jgi:AcrR family transcriptional regulator